MNDKKQTAVEWLFNELCSEKLSWNKDNSGKLFFDKITSDILQQAKEIEKEQMFQSLIWGCEVYDAWDKELEFKVYYKETFNPETNETI